VQFRRIKTCENLRTCVRQRRYSANDLAIVTLCDKAPFLITWRVDNNDVVKTCLPYSSPGFQNIQHHKCSTLFGNDIQPVIGSAPRNGLTTSIDVHDALRIRTRGNDRETAGKRKQIENFLPRRHLFQPLSGWLDVNEIAAILPVELQ